MKTPARRLFSIAQPDHVKRLPDLRRIEAKEALQALVISEKVRWFGIHWMGERSQPCDGPAETCTLHAKGIPAKELGYVHCLCLDDRREYFVELTPFAIKAWKLAMDTLTTLRGHIVCFTREKGHKKSPVRTVRLTDEPKDMTLLREKDPEPTLLRLYGMEKTR